MDDDEVPEIKREKYEYLRARDISAFDRAAFHLHVDGLLSMETTHRILPIVHRESQEMMELKEMDPLGEGSVLFTF